MSDMRAGVIGLGQMGSGIARRIDAAGMLAGAWDSDSGARERSGVAASLPPAEWAREASAILFVVPGSRAVEDCLDGGVLAKARPGTVLLDLTTSHPAETKRLALRAAEHGLAYLDAGMSGGAAGADAGRLTLMVGGAIEAVQLLQPVFTAIAGRVIHVGGSGAGHTVKLIHNMVCHTNFLALAEACRMAERAGLGLPEVIEVINAGNARSFVSERRFPDHVLSGRFDGRSSIANLAKDLGMAAELAASLGQPSPYTALTSSLLQGALEGGHDADDFTSIYPRYDALAGDEA